MSSVSLVPEVAARDDERLTARDAWAVLRSCRVTELWRASWSRFRYGDGFSHARALGLQLSLAAVPLLIAAIGLSNLLETPSVRLLVDRTVLQLSPSASDAMVRRVLSPWSGEPDGIVLATVLGLAAATLAMATAMGQLERGANRIYGIQRDRPTVAKYRRALLLAGLAGVPLLVGSLLVTTLVAAAEAMDDVYGVEEEGVVLVVGPIAVGLLLAAITLMLRRAPHRRQPGWSMLVLGSVLALVLWTGLTLLLAGALDLIGELGSAYGPLTGVIALLFWAQLTSAAIFLAFAVSAELELAAIRTAEGRPARTGAPAADSRSSGSTTAGATT
ncbi:MULTISPECIES: YihY/virulence factor BrkB family protein [unclassified Modestobacter]|uniref:YihY/virulence factor BrkB family protein n=1 Tax=unclassified Modestobacter TaxID=2643866 RepID=UPI0022AA18C0|nr:MULTISPECIES: YihY/virulence factor BrkB family protein [unclassified Modestobacter]MCZ2827167.1 YihY/virulence factor BrkB family protein [Modestobacter sp. VKM Ac-2981]MCZ2854418.1 YihY/virulence factor BrkB family protein [Modestobacter sp. VKM Ac-2982]